MDGLPLDVILVVSGGIVAAVMLVTVIFRKLAGYQVSVGELFQSPMVYVGPKHCITCVIRSLDERALELNAESTY